MKKVYQTLFADGEGNCFQAALASVLELDLEEVPHFCLNGGSEWYDRLLEWLRSFGLSAVHIQATTELLESANFEGCFYIVSGKSPRGVEHSTVYRGKKCIHDPFKGSSGVVPTGIDVIFPVDPARIKLQR